MNHCSCLQSDTHSLFSISLKVNYKKVNLIIEKFYLFNFILFRFYLFYFYLLFYYHLNDSFNNYFIIIHFYYLAQYLFANNQVTI